MASHTDGTVALYAVGDLMLGDSAIATGFGFAGRYSRFPVDGLSQLKSLFNGADIVFGNLEATLSVSGHRPRSWKSTQMRGLPSYATSLRRAGFDVLSVANNHASQHGTAAFNDTVQLLEAAGIRCCGLQGTGPWSSTPVTFTRHAQVLGFLAYCLRPRQYGTGAPPYAEGVPAAMCEDIDRLKQASDHVIVSLHWGEEFVPLPSASEITLARQLCDAGATVIVGHHPHVLRPIVRYNRAVIAYSLGNFVSDMLWQEQLRRGALLKVHLGGTMPGIEQIPTYIGQDYIPRPEAQVGIEPVTYFQGEFLEDSTYHAAVRESVSANRTASYVYALKHIHRFRMPTAFQLIATTVRNKIRAAWGVPDT
jgi:gamma-polyglutamate biosynthesis protein CapA